MKRCAQGIVGLMVIGNVATVVAAAPAQAGTTMGRLAARITAPATGATGSRVTLSTARTTVPKGDRVTSYVVDFGDHSSTKHAGLARTLSHTYRGAGTYVVRLTVTDVHRHASTGTTRITVSSPKTAATTNLCGAPANPYGYNLCGNGGVVLSPPGDICSYFSCIANFDNGVGYMVECADGMYSMSGGRSGACSSHGGEEAPVSDGKPVS